MKKYKYLLLALSILAFAAFAGCEAENPPQEQKLSGFQTVETLQTRAFQETGNIQGTQETQGLVAQAQVQENLAIRTENVKYYENTEGFYAEPIEKGTYPGIVMIHEWWGLNDNIKGMAKKLAADGYRVLAVDLYGGKIAATLDEAKTVSAAVNEQEAIKNMQAAASLLKKQGAPKIASLGLCFGGGQALQLAISGEKLDATVIYYGEPVTEKEKLAAIKYPVLGIFAGSDTVIPLQSVKQFSNALTAAGVKSSIIVYPGVGHAFADPKSATYAPKQTLDAWQKTLNFLNENLK
jgi:carboxymethylenebutenolidase